LPPKERAAIVLKDVLGYQLAEVAEIADSTLGGAKAALHRAREKLRDLKSVPSVVSFDDEQRKLFEAYATASIGATGKVCGSS
jgi:RNA polymerase sigma-70 factor (ECF subfamily)